MKATFLCLFWSTSNDIIIISSGWAGWWLINYKGKVPSCWKIKLYWSYFFAKPHIVNLTTMTGEIGWWKIMKKVWIGWAHPWKITTFKWNTPPKNLFFEYQTPTLKGLKGNCQRGLLFSSPRWAAAVVIANASWLKGPIWIQSDHSCWSSWKAKLRTCYSSHL